MEEKYGFHYFTNAFCLAPATELEYTAFYTATAINPACYASMISWLLWLVVAMQSAFSLFAPDPEERFVGKLDLVISALVIVPVPLLVACCRAQRFRGYEQAFLCAIVSCFASVLLLGGAVSSVRDYRRFLMKDLDSLLNQITAESPASMSLNSSRIIHLDSDTAWWDFENFQGTGRALLVQYLETVILPIAHLNMSLLRPLIVLMIAPMFKLDPFHYIVAAFYVNIGYTLLVSLMYPPTRSVFYILNKFFLIFCLVGVTVVTVFRVRQTDRFLRLNFLHAKMVEDHARASQMQREIIINENKSLKKILEERNHSATGGPLDFDSPMTKVLTDLKSLQRSASLSPELRENLDGIVTLLSKKGHNLFAPDIHEQLKQKKEGDLDGDTKSWAATVLANKSYTRNRRASASYISQNKGGVPGTPQISSSVPQRFVEARLHPEAHLPTEDSLNAVATMMDRDGWSVDTFVVAEMSNNKPITYITYIVFEQHNLFELCTLNKNLLANFLSFLDIGYHRNPYHNNCHAADVVSSVEYLISVLDNGYIQDLLTYQEIFAATIAAAIHDFRHPGKTNNFMIKSGSDLTIEYSDSSVLERMHLAEAFFMVKDPLFNIFSGMAPAQFSDVRKAIIEMVLSTDLSVHLQLVGSLKTALISQETSDVIHSPMMVMKIVIKCADLGHSSKATKLHAKWSDMIIEEFFLQGDDEQTLGMDISPFMNRNNENSAKNQVGFFEFIILPFFEVVAEVIFRAEFKQILDQAHQNYKHWKRAEGMQLNSIKDILDQIFDVEGGSNSNALTPAPSH